MFLVQKANLSHHFRSTKKKPSHVPKPKPNLLAAAQLFDQNIIHHLKTLDLALDSSDFSLSSLSVAVSFLTTLHSEVEAQINQISDDHQDSYMDYSLKVLDLCNLISSAVNQLTNRRILINFSLRLLEFSDQLPAPEKLIKAKDTLARSGAGEAPAKEKGVRAKALIDELIELIDNLPRGKGRDLVSRMIYALGVLTVFVGSLLVTLLFGEQDIVKLRVNSVDFVWADSVNGLQDRIFDQIKSKKNAVSEVYDVARQAMVVRDLVEVVANSGDKEGDRARLDGSVKEMAIRGKRLSDGIDALTNGVNGLFRTVLKIRNGRLNV